MKNFFVSLLLLLLLTAPSPAQTGKFSAGIVGTSFINAKQDQRISGIKNPSGYGIAAGYQIRENAAIALTGEFFKGSTEFGAGTESNTRLHLSFYVFPLPMQKFNPYISGGMVYSRADSKPDNGPAGSIDRVYARFGAGADFPVWGPVHINGDYALYTDGWNYKGMGGSVGLRCQISAF